MLGWNISIFLQKDDAELPGPVEPQVGKLLATWRAGLDGLDWIDELVRQGKATDLGGDGYPRRYGTTAENLSRDLIESYSQSSDQHVGVKIDISAIKSCIPRDKLLIEAWDES